MACGEGRCTDMQQNIQPRQRGGFGTPLAQLNDLKALLEATVGTRLDLLTGFQAFSGPQARLL